MRRKISADVDGGLSGVSRCADTGARTPIGVLSSLMAKKNNLFIQDGHREIGPSVDDQAVSLSDDGTTIIIDFWSERVRAPSASFRHDGTTIIIAFFSSFLFSLSFFLSFFLSFYRHSTRHTLHLHFNPD